MTDEKKKPEIRTITAASILDWMKVAAAKASKLEIRSTKIRDDQGRLIVSINSPAGDVAQATINDYVKAKAEFLRGISEIQKAVKLRQASALARKRGGK